MDTFKNTILLITAAFFLVSFSVLSQTNNYNADITFTIKKISRWNKINTGTSLLVPEKGYKYFMITAVFENHSAEKQIVDFNTFFLVDHMMNLQYPIKHVMSISGVTKFHEMQKKLSKKSKTKLTLVVICPENYIPEILLVNDQQITIPEKLFNP